MELHEYATGLEHKIYTISQTPKRLNTDRLIKDYSEIEFLVEETLTKMGVNFSKDRLNIKVLEPSSFDKIKKIYGMNTKSAFVLMGLFYKIRYGKWYNIFKRKSLI